LDGDLYLAQLLGDGKGEILASIIHKRLKTKDKGSGTATSAITVRQADVEKYAVKLVKKMKWLGVVSPEFMISSRYGQRRPLLIEINPRIAGQSHLSTCAGVNLAYYLILLAKNKIIKDELPKSYELGLTFFRVWQDIVIDSRGRKLSLPR
jgi:predicted ATP-grasp superfamily ATP-dependent carboligase